MLQRIQAAKAESCNLRYHPLRYPDRPAVSKFYQGTLLSLKDVSIWGTRLSELSCPPLPGCSALFLTSEDRIFFLEFLGQLYP